MAMEVEINHLPPTPAAPSLPPRLSSCSPIPNPVHPSPLPSPSLPDQQRSTPTPFRTPWSTPSHGFSFTPLASPAVRRAATAVRGYLEDVGHLTRLDPKDAWLPITESRRGNACFAAFHTLCSGVGFQALVLPVALAALGWTWGLICLVALFSWQLYTIWLLTRLHEAVPGTRYSRYMHLCMAAFGQKLGTWLAKFPIMYLSGGTCTALIVTGGGTLKLFFEVVCGGGSECHGTHAPLTALEWYLVFVCLAVIISQLPNLHSIAGVSLIGAATAIGYCTMLWAVPVAKGRPDGVIYDPLALAGHSAVRRVLDIVNGVGIIAFAFRGHNVTLEIQATIPSTLKSPSHIPMWRGVKIAYALIALCLFPIAIGGYWAYGNKISPNGTLAALHSYHAHDTSRALLALATLLVAINCLSSFQIYAMPVFDTLELGYVNRHHRPCPPWLRTAIRVFFGCLTLFIAVALPFLPDLAALIGGIALPVTLAYPCFMWVVIKKPRRLSGMWYANWGLGMLGMVLSFVLVVGGLWNLLDKGLKLRFFRAR